MSEATPHAAPERLDPVLEIVVPAHDEEADLARCIDRLSALAHRLDYPVQITIVDSGSSDGTWALAEALADASPIVQARRVRLPGRGRALRAAWMASTAPVLAYTDVDLSADPAILPAMVELVRSGSADIVVGSRLHPEASVVRRPGRETLSQGYSQLLGWLADPPFRDAQCGLKVASGEELRGLLPRVVDEGWFTDTELLLRAWDAGLTVVEVPVDWREREDTRVKLVPTILGDLRGLARLAAERSRRPHGPGGPTAPPRSTSTPTPTPTPIIDGVLLALLVVGATAWPATRRSLPRWLALVGGGSGAVRGLRGASRRSWRPRGARPGHRPGPSDGSGRGTSSGLDAPTA